MSNHYVIHIPETTITGKRLGRHVERDERSRAFSVASHATGVLKTTQHRRHCSPFNQGDLGSCTGNAMVGALMTGPLFKATRILGEQDAVDLYSAATRLDRIPGHYPHDDTGSSGLAVAKAAQQRGYISSYRHAFGISQALTALSRGPVIVGVNWYEGFDMPVGTSAELQILGTIRGGHEMVIDGIDVESGYVHLTNSWGSQWGNQGTCVMSFATLRRLLVEGGDVTVPT